MIYFHFTSVIIILLSCIAFASFIKKVVQACTLGAAIHTEARTRKKSFVFIEYRFIDKKLFYRYIESISHCKYRVYTIKKTGPCLFFYKLYYFCDIEPAFHSFMQM